MSSIMRLDDLVDAMRVQLPRLGINSFFISRFEKEWAHTPNTPWDIPEQSLFIAGALDGNELEARDGEMERYPSNYLYPAGLVNDMMRRSLVVFPLFSGRCSMEPSCTN
jgi:hypothetical protein